jgi:hypothetical protein
MLAGARQVGKRALYARDADGYLVVSGTKTSGLFEPPNLGTTSEQ